MRNSELGTSVESPWSPSNKRKVMAWLTHLLTASGVIWGMMAVVAITESRWVDAFVWMALAVLIDAVDGFVARIVQVKVVLPGIDGALLDNVVDYLNYVFVPAYFLMAADLIPERFSVLAASSILLVSAYQFCQDDAKTQDHYFKGFPSYWNIVVFYFVMLGSDLWLNLIAVVVLSMLVFVPIKYIYPSRNAILPNVTLILGIIWGFACAFMLMQFPLPSPLLVRFSLIYVAYYVTLSLYATFAGQLLSVGKRVAARL